MLKYSSDLCRIFDLKTHNEHGTHLTTLLSGLLISIETPVSEYADRLISENCACRNTCKYGKFFTIALQKVHLGIIILLLTFTYFLNFNLSIILILI